MSIVPSTMTSSSTEHIGTGGTVTRRAKRNSKSGCRTCKIRKVKCDEDRPACRRCLSTGRLCDGYGIWGGGETYYSRRIIPRSPAPAFLLVSSPKDKEYFEWFKCRTVIKLPGFFVSGFWNTLLFQASTNEPAVLHALLALSSIHKRGIVDANDKTDNREEYALNRYVKAIGLLKPHFLTKDRTSYRIALITCVVFVCLEFLRGHFNTAQTHLQNGLKILCEMQIIASGNDGVLRFQPCRESTDEWIVEAFSRLHLMVELFKHSFQHPGLVLQAPGPENPNLIFRSLNQASQQMERLLNRVFHLTHLGRRQTSPSNSEYPQLDPLALLEDQKHIRKGLEWWLNAYKPLGKTLPHPESIEEKKGYQLLGTYHTMASIMLETSLQANDETVYDYYTNQFCLLIKQLINLRLIASNYARQPTEVPAEPGLYMDMAGTLVDLGWIPPLYYAAIKCRVHLIRLQAIRLLESTSHREGIWDSRTAACVARKVIEVEERNFYKDLESEDVFILDRIPSFLDLALPTIPEDYRLREIEVVLEGSPMDRILLFCKRERGGIDCRVLISEYDVHLQSWRDAA